MICSDLDIDECSKNPCNSGDCQNNPGSYSCNCYPGWLGSTCDGEKCPHVMTLDRFHSLGQQSSKYVGIKETNLEENSSIPSGLARYINVNLVRSVISRTFSREREEPGSEVGLPFHSFDTQIWLP